MASQLQNRLVGSVILVALAVIIVPSFFDGKAPLQQSFEQIPEQPYVDLQPQQPKPIPAQPESAPIDTAAISEPSVNADEAAAIDNDSEVKAPAREVATTVVANEPGYVIQLGAFRNADSVARLVKQLQGKGFNAFSETTRSSDGKSLTRLLVGPDASKQALEKQLPELKALTELNGTVVSYQP